MNGKIGYMNGGMRGWVYGNGIKNGH